MGRERGMVGGADGVGGQDVVGVAERGNDSAIDLPGDGQVVFLLPGGKGFFALGAPAAIDAAGGEVVAVEADLNGEEDIDGNLRFNGLGRNRLDDGWCRWSGARSRRGRRENRRGEGGPGLDRHMDTAGQQE